MSKRAVCEQPTAVDRMLPDRSGRGKVVVAGRQLGAFAKVATTNLFLLHVPLNASTASPPQGYKLLSPPTHARRWWHNRKSPLPPPTHMHTSSRPVMPRLHEVSTPPHPTVTLTPSSDAEPYHGRPRDSLFLVKLRRMKTGSSYHDSG
ncbi:hypothetical protein E2C01_006482 [Portunus trituberculatus]|uniref:Uncharacterized protein n=1 Tax=Portunus trituberculatus TaxID=210409 RepID=A0A5B7CX00_PORTR|nr:hypothetical protein [Portunus trituberculatus]